MKIRTMARLTRSEIDRITGNAARYARVGNVYYAPDWELVDEDDWEKFHAPNFTPRELADTRTGELLIDTLALHRLQAYRNQNGYVMHITSGWRSTKTNAEVGGHPASAHMVGRAFDFSTRNTPASVAAMSRAIGVGFDGIGVRAHGRESARYMHVDDVARVTGTAFWTYA